MAKNPQDFLATAQDLATQAGQVVMGYLHGSYTQERKADNSPVTEADLASDKLIREGLRQAFPEHGILTEETGLLPGKNSEYLWVVDPLDGTKAFAKGIPGFCVMIGLLKNGVPELGVVMDPLEGRLYDGLRGGGAFQTYQGKRQALQVSSRQDFSEMPLLISTGFPSPKLEEAKTRLGCPVLKPINSVGIKVGLLVRQVGDIYLNHHGVHYWDTCAPQVILEAAGGKMTLLNGQALRYEFDEGAQEKFCHPTPTLATNGTRHQDLLELCDELLGSPLPRA